MTTQLVAFDSTSALPGFLRADTTGNLAAFVGGGFDTLSIKGKVFHFNRNGEKILLTKPGGEAGEPAPSVEVVILDIGPRGKLSSRIFYLEKYVEGSVEAPDCSSNDGVAPDADVKNAQAKKCAVCPQNVKGSGATATNPTGKACGSNKRLSLATPDNLGAPMLLRVPGDSIVALSEHLTVLKNRGVPNSYGVVTKIGFDYSVSHAKLTFKPVSFVSAEQYTDAGEVAAGDLSQQIIGIVPAPVFEDDAPVVPPAATAAEKFVAPKAPKTVIKVDDDADVDATLEIPAVVAPLKAATVKRAKAAVPVVEESIPDGMAATLDDLDFDD